MKLNVAVAIRSRLPSQPNGMPLHTCLLACRGRCLLRTWTGDTPSLARRCARCSAKSHRTDVPEPQRSCARLRASETESADVPLVLGAAQAGRTEQGPAPLGEKLVAAL